MSLNDAHAFAFSLATTLMAAIIIFQAGDGTLSVTPASEYDGDMAAMTFSDCQAMVEETVLDTRMVEFRLPDGRLAAAGLIDWLEDGPSAVYSFFLPELAARSLGSQVILWLAAEAARRDLPHVYLGYWIAETRKMAYKARFRPLEALGPEGWSDLAAS